MENTDFPAIAELLEKPSRIVVTTHANPDGDAIGSSLALASYFNKKGHQSVVIVPDPFPDFLAWMPGAERIMIYRGNKEECDAEVLAADIIFCADYNQLDRLNEASDVVRKSSAVKVLIDHHLEPSQEFGYKISVTRTSSTSELVYDFINSAGDRELLDSDIAVAIYTGIITDTGSLSYACNFEKTYLVVADLFRLGIDGELIHRLVYDTYSESRLRLLGYSISDKLVVLKQFNTAYITLSKPELDRFEYRIGDTEGIVNYALSIKDINFAALFMERDGIVKASFRSKGNFPVNVFAKACFSGGGHRNAAGANCYVSLEDALEKFIGLLPEYQPTLKNVY